MKKISALLLAVILVLSLYGCSSKEVNNTETENLAVNRLVYTYSCVKCVDNLSADIQDDTTVVSSADELNSYKSKISAAVDTEKPVQGESSATLSQKMSVYNDAFFESKKLIIVRRNFVTDNELLLKDFTVNDKIGNIEAEFNGVGSYEKSVRFIFIQVNSEDFPEDTSLNINISDYETTTSVTNVSMMVAKGDKDYKTISDADEIASIKGAVSSYKYTSIDYTEQEYVMKSADIMISYQGYNAMFTDTFICIDGKYYAPNSEAKLKMVSIYNLLKEATQTIPDDSDITGDVSISSTEA